MSEPVQMGEEIKKFLLAFEGLKESRRELELLDQAKATPDITGPFLEQNTACRQQIERSLRNSDVRFAVTGALTEIISRLLGYFTFAHLEVALTDPELAPFADTLRQIVRQPGS